MAPADWQPPAHAAHRQRSPPNVSPTELRPTEGSQHATPQPHRRQRPAKARPATPGSADAGLAAERGPSRGHRGVRRAVDRPPRRKRAQLRAHVLASLALAETVLALLLRRRKPIGALAGVLAAYLLFSLDPLLLPAVLLALFTVATLRDHRTVAIGATGTATVLAATPYIHGDAVSFTGYSLPRLAAAGAAVAAGTCLPARRNRRAMNPAQRSGERAGAAGPPGVRQPASRSSSPPAIRNAAHRFVDATRSHDQRGNCPERRPGP